MIAGQLEIQLFANLARLQSDMNQAKATVGNAMGGIESAIGKAKSVLGLFGVGLGASMFADMIKGSIDAMDHLNDLSKTTRISVEDLSGLKLAAKQSGSDLDAIASSINKLGVNMGKDSDKFKQLGISTKDPLEAFKQLADIMNQIEDPQTRAALGAATLGKKWEGAAPLMAEGSKRIQEMIDKGKELAGVTTKDAEAADEFNDRLDELKAAAEGAKNQMVVGLLPSLTNITKAITEAKRESGLLMAIWTGLGGIGAYLFTDETLSDAQRMAKTVDELNGQIKLQEQRLKDAADLAGPYGVTIRAAAQAGIDKARAELKAIEDIKAAKARAEQEEKDRAAKAKVDGKKDADAAAARAKAFLDNGAAAKVYKNELDNLEKQLAAVNHLGELEAYTNKLQEDSYKGLSDKQKQHLIDTMALIIAKKQELETSRLVQASQAAALNAEQAVIDQKTDYTIALRENVQAMQFETDLQGRSADEAQRMVAMHQMDLQLRQALAALPEGATETADEMRRKTEAAKARVMVMVLENQIIAEQQQRWAGVNGAAAQYFGQVGASISKLITTMAALADKQVELEKKKYEASKINDPEKRADLEKKLAQQTAQVQLGAYGDMADAASGFFDKQSKGYRALQTVSQVFHAAELAMTLAELVPKAISAVLTQGQGDPYTAFARMAAMTALVAGLGVAVGGGSGKANTDAADRQKAQGTGSVLGDVSAKSESIKKSMDLLANNSVIGNEHTSQMVRSLLAIENSLAGLGALVVRSAGLTGADTSGLGIGTKANINIPKWLDPIGILGGLFGKSKTELTDSGIQLNAQSFGQARQGVSANSYAQTQTTTSALFGLIKRTSESTKVDALSTEITHQFTMILQNIYQTILESAKIFGSDGKAIGAILDAFQIDFTKISFKGMSGDEIEKALQGIFSKIGDDLAGTAFPGIEQFQKVGEGLLETLTRLAQEFAATDEIAKILGKDVSTAFGAVGFASIAARDDLVKLFGGIQELSDGVTKYYELFYSEGERAARSMGTLQYQFEQLNIAMPGSMEEFRKLVEAQDLSTASGRAMFAALVQIAPAFAQVTNSAAQMTQTLLQQVARMGSGQFARTIAQNSFNAAAAAWNTYDVSTGNPGASIADILYNLQHNFALVEQRAAYMASIGDVAGMQAANALLSAFENLNNVTASTAGTIGDFGTTIGTTIDTTAQALQQMTDARHSLAQYLTGLMTSAASPLSPQQQYEFARTQWQTHLGLAQAGNNPAEVAGLQKYFDEFIRLSRLVNGSNGQYNVDYFTGFNAMAGMTAGEIQPYSNQTAMQLHSAQMQAYADIQAAVYEGSQATIALQTWLAENGIEVHSEALDTLAATSTTSGTGFLQSNRTAGV